MIKGHRAYFIALWVFPYVLSLATSSNLPVKSIHHDMNSVARVKIPRNNGGDVEGGGGCGGAGDHDYNDVDKDYGDYYGDKVDNTDSVDTMVITMMMIIMLVVIMTVIMMTMMMIMPMILMIMIVVMMMMVLLIKLVFLIMIRIIMIMTDDDEDSCEEDDGHVVVDDYNDVIYYKCILTAGLKDPVPTTSQPTPAMKGR